jgi:chromosome segregation ATPase
MSSLHVQAEALNVAEREALERERGETGTEIARAREVHANIYQTIKHSLVIIKHKLLIHAAASSEGARDRNSERCDAAEAELASAHTQVEEAKSRNESLEAKNDAAREGLMRRIAELERFRADLTSLLRAEERDNDSNRAIAAALRSDASSHAATVARLEGSVEELNDSIAQMITQFKVQFSTLTEEKDQLAMKLDDEDQCKECVVCKELRKEYAFLPCGHMCVCKGCAASIQGQDRTCPLCQHVDHENLPLI